MILETALLQLHRPFFAKAIIEFGHDPLSSPYASSVLATHRAASTIIQLDTALFSMNPAWMGRCWAMFGFCEYTVV